MDCPRCGSINHRKDGIVGGRQRHYCKDCHYRYTVQQESTTKSAATRRLALEMYLEGLGFRAIGRILKISHTIVYYWVKEWGERVALPQKEEPVSVVELDEMHTYIGSKKTHCWVWIAVDRFGKRFISFVCGDRSTDTGMKLWKKIKNIPASVYYSDYWKSYKEFLPNVKHIQTKAETYTVEGYNSRIRHYLARFKRKGKCYSKAKHMIEKSLKLLFLKLNNELAIYV
ncbi:MAG: IS1 family transposase [Tannerella sp.]|uniref:IS1 family transposase n=1 Tax=Tannerella sp. TaxID=2382127 RepID=UPI003FA29992